MKNPWQPQIEAFLSRSASLAPDDLRWLNIYRQAESANGDLVQMTATPGEGRVKLRDTWVVGFIGDVPRFSVFSDRPKEEHAAVTERLRRAIGDLPDGAPLVESFSAKLYATGHKTIAAYGFGHTDDGREVELLLHHPSSSYEEAVTCLKMTLRLAEKRDAAAAPDAPPSSDAN